MRRPGRLASTSISGVLVEFQSRATLIRAFFYTTALENEGKFSNIRPLLDWLEYNGYTVVTKTMKEFFCPYGHQTVKGNIDIELADAMELADHVDQIVLFSGNLRDLKNRIGRPERTEPPAGA